MLFCSGSKPVLRCKITKKKRHLQIKRHFFHIFGLKRGFIGVLRSFFSGLEDGGNSYY